MRTFRFAPSPNGLLHLGHARSALLNQRRAREGAGRLLLRIEDIDTARCTPELEAAMLEDLTWIGFRWDAPPLRQSERFGAYEAALERLAPFLYDGWMSRGELRSHAAAHPGWPRDPDGAPFPPPAERDPVAGRTPVKRLDMACALAAHPDLGEAACWGDPVLRRRDTPASYHLCVVVDDAAQGVTDVVRGADLAPATSLHRLLQRLLGLPSPFYEHHPLVLGADGRKLSKSQGATGLAALREGGASAAQVRRLAFSLPEPATTAP